MKVHNASANEIGYQLGGDTEHASAENADFYTGYVLISVKPQLMHMPKYAQFNIA